MDGEQFVGKIEELEGFFQRPAISWNAPSSHINQPSFNLENAYLSDKTILNAR
jgi:hypothetical protein